FHTSTPTKRGAGPICPRPTSRTSAAATRTRGRPCETTRRRASNRTRTARPRRCPSRTACRSRCPSRRTRGSRGKAGASALPSSTASGSPCKLRGNMSSEGGIHRPGAGASERPPAISELPPATGGILGSSVRRTLKEGEIPNSLIDCVHAHECAGCPLIADDYVQQLTTKRSRVVTAVSHYPALELVFTRPVEPGEPIVGYRGRAKLIVAPSGAVGLYGRQGNHEVVDIPQCRVLAPALAEVAGELRALIADPPAAAR